MRTLSSVLNDEQVLSSAGFSVDKLHRFWLMRRVGPGARVLVWCMLNPSKAGSQGDDPTIRRVTGFTRAFGYDVAVVVNLFSWRATEPRDCLTDRLLPAAGPARPHLDDVDGRTARLAVHMFLLFLRGVAERSGAAA